MLELLIRLHEMRCCCERAKRNPHLTNGEKSVACFHKQLVRECLPVTVLNRYDRMKKTERTLLTCPEIFAMAVLVSTYRSLSRLQRRKLVRHFKTPLSTSRNVALRNGTTPRNRTTTRRFKVVEPDAAAKPGR